MSAATPAADAWRRFVADLDAAAAVVEGPLGARDARERAEGYRHLLRMVSVATEMLVEKADRDRPEFTRWMSAHRKILGDNPGTIYDAAVIRPDRSYRVAGNVGAVTYLGFCVYGTAADGSRRIVGGIDDVDLTVADDGTFALVVGPTPPDDGGDFLALEPDATDLMVRQYVLDPEHEVEATYTIEPLDDPGPPPPLTEEVLAERLAEAGRFVADNVHVEASLSGLLAMATPALLRHGADYLDAHGEPAPPPVDPGVVAKMMPSPAIQYSGTWFDGLGDDEVVVVEGRWPEARYCSVVLLSRWMESGDWRHHRCVLTSRELEVAPDGSFRVVVAHRDPGEPNWLDTTGLANGSIAIRALGADDQLQFEFRRETRG